MHSTAFQFLQNLPSTISFTNNTISNLTNPSFVSSSNPKNLFTTRLSMFSLTSSKTFNRASPSSMSRILLVKCNLEERENEGFKDLLAGMVDKQVEELLNKKENRVLLDGLQKATRRVEMAKKELDEIKKQEFEAAQMRNYVNQLETRTSEIAECQREILEARTMVEEAERTLSINMDSSVDGSKGGENEEVDKDKERWESVKAAIISATVGTLAGLPISLSHVTTSIQLLLLLGITFISCALFGVTFRYTIRRDLDNIQLKTGTSAAFGFIKGLSVLGAGPPLELDFESFLSHAIEGVVNVSENLFIFIFAAVALDYCFKMGILSPFPIQRSDSQTIIR